MQLSLALFGSLCSPNLFFSSSPGANSQASFALHSRTYHILLSFARRRHSRNSFKAELFIYKVKLNHVDFTFEIVSLISANHVVLDGRNR